MSTRTEEKKRRRKEREKKVSYSSLYLTIEERIREAAATLPQIQDAQAQALKEATRHPVYYPPVNPYQQHPWIEPLKYVAPPLVSAGWVDSEGKTQPVQQATTATAGYTDSGYTTRSVGD